MALRTLTPSEVVNEALKALEGNLVMVEYVFISHHLDILATPGTDTCTRTMPILGQVYRHTAILTTVGSVEDGDFSFGAGSFRASFVDCLHIESGVDDIPPTIRLNQFWVTKTIKDPSAVRALLNF